MLKRASIFFIFLVLTATLVSALGVSPGRIKVDYVPNVSFDFEACFKASTTSRIRIEKTGFLEENIEFLNLPDDHIIDLTKENGCVKYRVHLPAVIDKPGRLLSDVAAVELPEGAQGNIVAIVRMAHIIELNIPYPGKYLDITGFSVSNVKTGGKAPVYASYINRGNETITAITGKVDLFNKDGVLVGTIPIPNDFDFKPLQTQDLRLNWDSGNNVAGNYVAVFTVYYDGAKSNATSNFKLGTLDVVLKRSTENLLYAAIQPFEVDVDSLWSEEIKDVNVKVSIYNFSYSNISLESFETNSVNLAPWGGANLKGFADTNKIGLGKFDVILDLQYGGETKQYKSVINITELPKPVVPKKSLKEMFFNTTTLLVLLVIVLLAVLVIVIRILIPKKKKDEKSG